MKDIIQSNKFNLILSGGAALGYAHIGVLKRLKELNKEPASYHGVSMGAIISAIEASEIANKQKLYDEVFDSLSWIKPKLNGALLSTKKIEKLLLHYFGDMKMSDLKKALFIGATNYENGAMTIFSAQNDCKIVDAILASIAIPGVFEPRIINGMTYVDGYLSSNILLDSVNNNYMNLIVNVTGKEAFKKLHQKELLDFTIFAHLERSIRITIYNQTRLALKAFDKEYILIEPPLSSYKTSSFHKYQEIVEVGYKSAKKILG